MKTEFTDFEQIFILWHTTIMFLPKSATWQRNWHIALKRMRLNEPIQRFSPSTTKCCSTRQSFASIVCRNHFTSHIFQKLRLAFNQTSILNSIFYKIHQSRTATARDASMIESKQTTNVSPRKKEVISQTQNNVWLYEARLRSTCL